jgi:hypothetical protein
MYTNKAIKILLAITFFIGLNDSITAQSFQRFQNYFTKKLTLSQVKIDLSRDYIISAVGERVNNGETMYRFINKTDNSKNVEFLYNDILNTVTYLTFTDLLVKQSNLQNELKNILGYYFQKKISVEDNYGNFTGVFQYGYRKGNFLCVIETGGSPQYLKCYIKEVDL